MNEGYLGAIDSAAQWVVDRRLESAAVLLLEINKPLSFLMGQTLHFGTFLLAPLFGLDRLQKAAGILSDSKSFEALISRIEKLSAERSADKSNA